MEATTAGGPDKSWHRAATSFSIGLALVAIFWVIFTYVVTDRALLLEYLRVLAWPLLVAVALFWLREPLREKLLQLLRIEVPGGSAQFAGSGEELARSLKPDVDNLLGDEAAVESGEHPESGEVASDEAPGVEGVVEHDANGESPQLPSPVEVTPVQLESPVEPQTGRPTQTEAQHLPEQVQDRVSVSRVRLLELAKTAGLGPKAAARVTLAMRDDPDAALKLIQAGTTNSGVPRSQQSRDSIESIIRKSAAWGYDMGVAGAPGAEPEIEWNPDGSWRITTEVPPRSRSGAVVRAMQMNASHARHVKELEDEIKEAERKKLSPFSASARLDAEPWLRELKSRLVAIDPGNPWAF